MYRADGALSEETSDKAECPLTVAARYNSQGTSSTLHQALRTTQRKQLTAASSEYIRQGQPASRGVHTTSLVLQYVFCGCFIAR